MTGEYFKSDASPLGGFVFMHSIRIFLFVKRLLSVYLYGYHIMCEIRDSKSSYGLLLALDRLFAVDRGEYKFIPKLRTSRQSSVRFGIYIDLSI